MSTHAALPTVEEALFSEQNGKEIEDMYASVVIGGYSGGVRCAAVLRESSEVPLVRALPMRDSIEYDSIDA